MRQNPSFKSYDISGSHDAIRAFGEDDSLLVARPNRNCCKFWFTVPEVKSIDFSFHFDSAS